ELVFRSVGRLSLTMNSASDPDARRYAVLLALAAILAALSFAQPATSQRASVQRPASTPTDDDGDVPRAVCELKDERITEASGIPPSRRNPDMYYTHNDSGGEPHVYLFDRQGRTRATIVVDGAMNIDWEDISLAPGENGGFDICAADIGDNSEK